MEKPQIIIEFEKELEFFKEIAEKEGREFNFENEAKLYLEKRILSIKSGFAVAPKIKRNKGIGSANGYYFSPSYDIPQLEHALEYIKFIQSDSSKKSESLINGTTKQSTLAIYYMQKALKFPRTTGVTTEDAAFVKFLIGKDFDEIRKLLAEPLKRKDEKTGKATQSLIKDLTIVLNQFKKIQFFDGVKLVENDLDKLENDLKTFNQV